MLGSPDQTEQAENIMKALIPKMKSGSHVCFSKVDNVSDSPFPGI